MNDHCCSKCGLNHRILVYRREPETYLCAVCVGEPSRGHRSVVYLSEREFGHGPLGAFTRDQVHDSLDAVVSPRNPFAEMKKRYTGFRLPNDRRES